MAEYDYAVVGGGIVGLSTAMALGRKHPDASIVVLEKEADWAVHQTGHNSGVIHSGIYYKPGSLKARLAREGSRSIAAFCEEHDIPHEVCGKVIVATHDEELPRMEKLFERGRENGLAVERWSADQVREREPHVRCRGGIYVPTAGIADYKRVCLAFAAQVKAQGGTLELNCRVESVREDGDGLMLVTSRGDFRARFLVACAGLHSDRVARAGGVKPGARIIPFRGEYYELVPERRGLVNHLIYPVPDPAFPFLGVHLTRMIDGSIHAGPNAVLGLKREGYRKTDISLRDLGEVLFYPGFWKLAARHWRMGMQEVHRSLSKAAFVRSLQQLVPEIQSKDLVPSPAGVRAQALQPDGAMVDDFLLVTGPRSVHVCNAPSPAATASIEIGKEIVARLPAHAP